MGKVSQKEIEDFKAVTQFKKILAIETSCDDTSVAILRAPNVVKTLEFMSQDLLHEKFGGIVPEIASRNHTQNLIYLIDKVFTKSGESLEDMDAIAVTSRPGLVGSLIVGVTTARSLGWSANIPVIGVNHLESHIWAAFLEDESHKPHPLSYPFLCLAVSGGHTHLYLIESFGKYHLVGKTKDDAAGEAFDKFAKLLGLNFPGGAQVDLYSESGDRKFYNFPRPSMHEDNFSFSFSGLKTAAQRMLQGMSEKQIRDQRADLCASYQEAIVDCLVNRMKKAIRFFSVNGVVVTGGVSANRRLRQVCDEVQNDNKIPVIYPPLKYCTDNAAMVGYVGMKKLNLGDSRGDLKISPNSYKNDFL